MTLTYVNKTVYQGQDDALAFVIVGGSDGKTPVDITTATFNWTAYHVLTGDVLSKELGSGLAFGTAKDGQLAATLTAAELSAIPALTYEHILQMILPVGKTDTLTTIEAMGYLTVEPNRIEEEPADE